jgi:hypothetical protein
MAVIDDNNENRTTDIEKNIHLTPLRMAKGVRLKAVMYATV